MARPRRAIVGWVLFDWACQPFFTLVTTFVFAPYFAAALAPDPVSGQALWGYATAAAGLTLAGGLALRLLTAHEGKVSADTPEDTWQFARRGPRTLPPGERGAGDAERAPAALAGRPQDLAAPGLHPGAVTAGEAVGGAARGEQDETRREQRAAD